MKWQMVGGKVFKTPGNYIRKTALHLAAMNGDLETAENLLDRNILHVDVRDNEQWTPLYYAAFHGHLSMVKLLLRYNANLHLTDVKGLTPLHEATRGERRLSLTDGYGHADIVHLFLQQGANSNAKDNDGYSPLHYATSHGDEQLSNEMIKMTTLLLNHHADVFAKNNYNETPLDLAIKYKRNNIIKLLTVKVQSVPKPAVNVDSYQSENFERDLILALELSKISAPQTSVPSVGLPNSLPSQGGMFSSPVAKPKSAKIPNAFLCPITHEIMDDPVIFIVDNYTYERSAITDWLNTHHDSPMTREKMTVNQTIQNSLRPNRVIKEAIDEFKMDNADSLIAQL